MDVSIIIVNYNVKYFLEQCLYSVYNAKGTLKIEVIVVDNNSLDGSEQMMKDKFPNTFYLRNNKNLGFSKANNRAIEKAQGKYVLLLNPDTVIQEDTLQKSFQFMESHPEAGCLGVKMIDGNGHFLPESKRSVPTPLVSFFKIFGFSSLFPKSKLFAKYHLGYLDENQVHEVSVLPGAYMFIRRKALDEVGLLDESFFMYGEDIDLSYRLIKGGYKNYYYPKTTIIHYKGESTKKGSINYVLVFYQAMIIFAEKHFSKKNARIYSFLINTAVYIRALMSIIKRGLESVIIPITDFILVYLVFGLLESYWSKVKFGMDGYYPDEYMRVVVPGYILVWLVFLYISGAYEKKTSITNIGKGVLIGTVLLLVIYALLPVHMRYSRLLILVGAATMFLVAMIGRIFWGKLLKIIKIEIGKTKKRIAIIGSRKETQRVMGILNQIDFEPNIIGTIAFNGGEKQENSLGYLDHLDEIIRVNKLEELIFCASDIPSYVIIRNMLKVSSLSVDFKIAPPESLSIIGSSSINTAGDFYVVNFNSLNKLLSKRKKRIFDVFSSILLLILYPLLIFIIKKPYKGLINIVKVLIGLRTWIGFYPDKENHDLFLPNIKKSILYPFPYVKNKTISDKTISRLNLLYAKDYKILNDISLLLRDIRYIGNNS